MIKDLIKLNRSYRRFDNSFSLDRQTLTELVELARFSPSASNRQLLRFCISYDTETNKKIFSCLRWAGYLTDWDGPQPAERPTGYIIILKPVNAHAYICHDTGIAAQSILLGAAEKGLGGCMFGSVDRDKLKSLLNIPENYLIEIVIAIGKPVEKVVLDDATSGENIKYWRDDKQVHHVPKIVLDDLIIDGKKLLI